MSNLRPQNTGESVLEAAAPALSIHEAEAFVLTAFDMTASARPLASERDQNFGLLADDGSEWVLRIANPAEDPALLEMQVEALLHIARVDPSLAVPRVKATAGGAHSCDVDGADGRRFVARVYYVETFNPSETADIIVTGTAPDAQGVPMRCSVEETGSPRSSAWSGKVRQSLRRSNNRYVVNGPVTPSRTGRHTALRRRQPHDHRLADPAFVTEFDEDHARQLTDALDEALQEM